jgi:hypothetical protein
MLPLSIKAKIVRFSLVQLSLSKVYFFHNFNFVQQHKQDNEPDDAHDYQLETHEFKHYILVPVFKRFFRSYLPEHGGISAALLTGHPTASLAVERISHGIFSRR